MRPEDSLSRGDEAFPGHPSSLGRFIIACFFAALAVVLLGLAFIYSYFYRSDEPGAGSVAWSVSAVGEKLDIRPAAARNQLRIFFTKDGIRLSAVTIPTKGSPDSHERGRLALQALFRGPSDDVHFSPAPPKMLLRSFYLMESEERQVTEAVIDLSIGGLGKPMGGLGAEMLCVYAIVNTALANCERADSARILIDGSPADSLWGHVDLSGPLLPWDMVSQ